MRVVPLAALAVLAATFYPAGARAADQTLMFRTAPIMVQGYGVNQGTQLISSPNIDGYVTGMSADVVDANGVSAPVTSVMLHYVVFVKAGAHDATCSRFTDYHGNRSAIPIERFYEEGEERAVLTLPDGYGYANRGSDRRGLVFMLMNHKPQTRTVYIQYTVHYSSGRPLTPSGHLHGGGVRLDLTGHAGRSSSRPSRPGASRSCIRSSTSRICACGH